MSDETPPAISPSWGPMRSFGRIKSRTLKPRQADLFDTLLPTIEVNDALIAQLIAGDLGGYNELWLEIGFGGGEHLAAQAERNPQALILGFEPFLNGVGSLLRHVDERGLTNVRLMPGDARPVIDRLNAASVDKVFILFPDPWPKARHHKRRFIQIETLDALARVMRDEARLRFATDWADYADWTLERATTHPAYHWPAQSPSEWNTPPVDHVTTRYEEKKLGDCAPVFLDFYRRARN
ncbi:tRNA (guanosine(46)-N7)-methyltransferase TrmB [Asticcacaulis sp. DW145]|uniref:tRNA (guanine-N(7)-)-methyltransferase n=1 Tax=Asticcacaulis currens TaxID=2984210 RepID=A0ABT5IA03_9CAUL|nr:tRNA (guanosine(46)-N7)-methyltransferase TrmB [Asticcacaulis currens]MDC7693018.1 tRNA (guanosine(46)-N7)-methyltransferase TrmB [Asticcacaulis currens]BEV09604.1 tRNA (guanosine(46)-N7)-methyltransferase TrmB [Asticcacaulis sp. DW145]